jgi:hypothetical protein
VHLLSNFFGGGKSTIEFERSGVEGGQTLRFAGSNAGTGLGLAEDRVAI